MTRVRGWFRRDPELVAAPWARWFGVPLAVLAGSVVAFVAPGTERLMVGLILAGGAVALWLLAVAVGAVQIRPRDSELNKPVFLARMATIWAVWVVVHSAVPTVRSSGLVVDTADTVSAIVAGAAVGLLVTRAFARARQNQDEHWIS